MDVKVKDGFCTVRGVRNLKHDQVKKYRGGFRFQMNPEYVSDIIEQNPGLVDFLDYKFWKSWKKQVNTKSLPDLSKEDYKFKQEPFPHQRTAIAFARKLPAAGLFMDPGTGKTFCSIVVTEMRLQKKLIKKTLVIAPSSILMNGWYEDIKKFSDLKVCVVHDAKGIRWTCPDCGRNVKRYKPEKHKECTAKPPYEIHWWDHKKSVDRLYNCDADIYVASPDMAHRYKDDFINKGFDFVIVDEAVVLRGKSVGKAIHEIGWTAKYRLILTGTPILNEIGDVRNLVNFLDMSLPYTDTEYYAKYYWTHPQHHYIRNLLKGSDEKIMEIVDKRCLKIKKEDCIKLPPRIQKIIEVEPDKDTLKTYIKFKIDLFVHLRKMLVKTDNALTEIMRLHQIINGFVTMPNGDRNVICERPPKARVTYDLVKESVSRGKVIIWCVYRHDFWALRKELEEFNPAILNGSSKTQQELDKFHNDPTCQVVIAHPKSARYGHTWNFAKTTIFYTFNYDLENYWQARDRNFRIGQNDQTFEYILTYGFIEDIILEAIQKKQNVANYSISLMSDLLNNY
jgi:SNF2 family DNA or RNA helicase